MIYKRKVEMTSSPYGPYELGYTHVTMGSAICYNANAKLIMNHFLSSD
jgi:hypothetical protein